MPGICVTCCGWAMLSDNEVGVMTSSLTPTSPLSVKQPSRKREDVWRYAPDSSVHHSGIITQMTRLTSVWVARFMERHVI